jgi:glycosyltransferase involved in cell wall biosynthesis
MKYKVSVIVPAYNADEFIDQCLNSLLTQTLKELEIVVIDDASTDQTLLKINEYSHYDNVRIISLKENSGQGIARNEGIAAASGEFIGFLDSDDWASPSMFEELYDFASRDHLDMAICGLEVFDNVHGHIGNNVFEEGYRLDHTHEIQHKCFASRIIRKKFLDNNGIKFRNTKFEDVFLYADYFGKIKWYGILPKPLYHYRRGHGSTAGREDSKNWMAFHEAQLCLYAKNPTLKQAYSIIEMMPDRLVASTKRAYYDTFVEYFERMKSQVGDINYNHVVKKLGLLHRILLANHRRRRTAIFFSNIGHFLEKC